MSEPATGRGNRPERVIVVDADDPLREIHGAFVWQDEHERVVAEARAQAYAEGFAAGQHRLDSSSAPVTVVLKRSRRPLWWLKACLAAVFVVFVVLMLVVVFA